MLWSKKHLYFWFVRNQSVAIDSVLHCALEIIPDTSFVICLTVVTVVLSVVMASSINLRRLCYAWLRFLWVPTKPGWARSNASKANSLLYWCNYSNVCSRVIGGQLNEWKKGGRVSQPTAVDLGSLQNNLAGDWMNHEIHVMSLWCH